MRSLARVRAAEGADGRSTREYPIAFMPPCFSSFSTFSSGSSFTFAFFAVCSGAVCSGELPYSDGGCIDEPAELGGCVDEAGDASSTFGDGCCVRA